MFRPPCLYKCDWTEHLEAETARDRPSRSAELWKKRRAVMGLSARFKDVVRRMAVNLFGIFELLGLPRIPEKREDEGGGKG